MSTTTNVLAHRLVHCQHVHTRKVVAGAPAQWCTECGAFFDGERWHRPNLHAPLKHALTEAGKVSDRLRAAQAHRPKAKKAKKGKARKTAAPRVHR